VCVCVCVCVRVCDTVCVCEWVGTASMCSKNSNGSKVPVGQPFYHLGLPSLGVLNKYRQYYTIASHSECDILTYIHFSHIILPYVLTAAKGK